MLSATEFEALLPWYLGGTLDERQSQQILEYLRAHPEEQWQVGWNADVQAAVVAQDKDVPRDIGLKRALASLRQEEFAQLALASGRRDENLGSAEKVTDEQMARGAETGRAAGGALFERKGGPASKGQITELLRHVNDGDKAARDALFALAYGELRRLAHVRLYEGGRSNLLDTTALVHETYIRFIQSAELHSEDRRSFFAFASRVMRNVIVDTARARLAQRRGGGGGSELTLSTQLLEQLPSGEEAILEVHEALLVLEQAEPRLAQLVEMRYYGGYSEAEIAVTLGVTERTVQRDWNKARLLLKAALGFKK